MSSRKRKVSEIKKSREEKIGDALERKRLISLSPELAREEFEKYLSNNEIKVNEDAIDTITKYGAAKFYNCSYVMKLFMDEEKTIQIAFASDDNYFLHTIIKEAFEKQPNVRVVVHDTSFQAAIVKRKKDFSYQAPKLSEIEIEESKRYKLDSAIEKALQDRYDKKKQVEWNKSKKKKGNKETKESSDNKIEQEYYKERAQYIFYKREKLLAEESKSLLPGENIIKRFSPINSVYLVFNEVINDIPREIIVVLEPSGVIRIGSSTLSFGLVEQFLTTKVLPVIINARDETFNPYIVLSVVNLCIRVRRRASNKDMYVINSREAFEIMTEYNNIYDVDNEQIFSVKPIKKDTTESIIFQLGKEPSINVMKDKDINGLYIKIYFQSGTIQGMGGRSISSILNHIAFLINKFKKEPIVTVPVKKSKPKTLEEMSEQERLDYLFSM